MFMVLTVLVCRLGGHPGSYLYVFESYRMEEVCTQKHYSLMKEALMAAADVMYDVFAQCAHGGCLMELCIQLSITMLGKQLIQNNLFEIGVP